MGTSHGAFIHPRTFSSLELAGPHRTAASQPARKRGSAFREGTPRAAQRQRHHFFFQRSQRHRLLFWQSALVSPRRRCARSRLNKHASATEHSPIGAGVGFLAPVRLDPSATTTTTGGGGAHPRGACCHFVSIVARARHAIPPRAYGVPPHVAYARTGEGSHAGWRGCQDALREAENPGAKLSLGWMYDRITIVLLVTEVPNVRRL
jgi:hypothetical protein